MALKRFAFVVPRFSESNIGGAENLCASLAVKLAERGDSVEIFTTCASDNRTWENVFAPGLSREYGLPVHRFSVDARNLEIWVPLQIRLHQGGQLTADQQLSWMQHSVNSQALCQQIARRQDDFDAWFFAPYLFGTTFHGSLVAPHKSILIPCLHDESYAYTEVVASMFRQTRGCFFNAAAEQRLANRLYGAVNGGVVGMGFDCNPVPDIQPFFSQQFPYLLYLGRKETGKNVDGMLKLFLRAKQDGKLAGLKMVIAGGGSFDDLHLPQAAAHPDVIDLQHLSEQQKLAILKYALALCQPSTNESFSIVLMESWLAGTPGLVNAYCDVTREHVEASSGGLYFGSYEDFTGCCEFLMRSPDVARQMAAAGRHYVEQEYSWEQVLKRFDRTLELIISR